ncbi:unnamed protein product [Schistosoma margrebowiei]|uniref:Cytochrome c oxidase assembly factor 3 mitochondrial coiled-coil domain-containing protein n=1 Tax=Schistosoma margrebowiei TaxID=48269 RepID=A0AA84Z8K9_9TREM|nr:unnamed protein product [Schistosoma margrebowiei]
MSDDKSDDVLRHFIKHTEKSNVRRSIIVQATKRKASVIALAAFGFACASYVYSLYAINRNRELGASFDQQPSYTSAE